MIWLELIWIVLLLQYGTHIILQPAGRYFEGCKIWSLKFEYHVVVIKIDENIGSFNYFNFNNTVKVLQNYI